MILQRLIVTLSVCLVPTAHAVNEFTARLPNVVGDEAMDIVRVFLESNSVPNAISSNENFLHGEGSSAVSAILPQGQCYKCISLYNGNVHARICMA